MYLSVKKKRRYHHLRPYFYKIDREGESTFEYIDYSKLFFIKIISEYFDYF